MNHLELFSGTHSFGKVSSKMGYNVISLDRDLGPECPFNTGYKSENHIMEDIMTWDYTVYPPKYFKIITASPSCLWWSAIRKLNYGKKLILHGGDKVFNETLFNEDIKKYGVPMVDKVFEIIDYFNPDYWIIENPKSGKMKEYINDLIPYFDVDYCRYGFDYKKPTRFWTNISFSPKKCNHKKHIANCCHGAAQGGGSNRLPRYKIPSELIEAVFRNI